MFLHLNHQNLEVYKVSRSFVKACYKLTNYLPPHERYNLISQIRRAALSVYLNLAEGSSRKSVLERKRFYEIARGSLIEVDTALDIVSDLEYCSRENLREIEPALLSSFKLLSLLIKKS